MEVQTQRGIVTFIMFADVLKDRYMEGNMLALDRKDNRTMFEINVYLIRFEVLSELGERIVGSDLSEFEVFSMAEE